MSRENYPRKVGHPNSPAVGKHNLGVDHLNQIGQNLERLNRQVPGPNLWGQMSGSNTAYSARPPFRQEVVRILGNQINADDDPESGLFLCVPRYFIGHPLADAQGNVIDQNRDGFWFNKHGFYPEVPWVLDTREHGGHEAFHIGDRVTAFYHEQRGVWVPCDDGCCCMPTLDASYHPLDGPHAQELTPANAGGVPAHYSEAAGVFFFVALSFDGGQSWNIAQDRVWSLNPNTRQDGPTSSSGFVSILASNGTLVRVGAFAGGRLLGARLVGAALKMQANCQGGLGAFHVPLGNLPITWADPFNIRLEQRNVVDNQNHDLPVFDQLSDTTFRVTTPWVDDGNPAAGREVWTVDLDVTLWVDNGQFQPDTHVEAVSDDNTGAVARAIPSTGTEDGGHAIFFLMKNGQVIGDKMFRIPLVEDARATGVGFVSFRAGRNDVISCGVSLANSPANEAELRGGSIRLEVKDWQRTRQTQADNPFPPNHIKLDNLEEQARNDFIAGADGRFRNSLGIEINDDNLTLLSTDDMDAATTLLKTWLIEAEFHVDIWMGILSSSSSSSQSSISTSSVSSSSSNSSSSSSVSSSLSSSVSSDSSSQSVSPFVSDNSSLSSGP